MCESEPITFTAKDLACESLLSLLYTRDPFGALNIAMSGVRYNSVKRGGDPNEIASAYRRLPQELKELKHNFLNRGKGHW